MIKCWPDYSQQEQDPWRCLSALTPKPTQLWIRFALQCKVQIFSQIFAIIFILTVMVILVVMMMMTWKVIPIDHDHDRWSWWSTWSENVVVDVVTTHNLLVLCHPGRWWWRSWLWWQWWRWQSRWWSWSLSRCWSNSWLVFMLCYTKQSRS